MKENYSIIIDYTKLYLRGKVLDIDWVDWCWKYIGVDNFTWTIDSSRSQTDLHDVIHYVYIIRFDKEEDKLLFILNWV